MLRDLTAPYLAWIKLGAVAAVIALLWWQLHAYGARRFDAGAAKVQAQWDASVERGKAEIARLRAAAGKITVKTETVYVDRIRTIREKGDAIVREVPVFVPAGAADLPGGFRLLHDAAAAGGPVPDAAAIADAAPVDAQSVAGTVAGNYAQYHEVAQRLISLQDWVREQCKANPPPEGCP